MNALGLGDSAVANELGLSYRSLQKWRYGERKIPNPVAIIIRMRVRGRTKMLNEVMKAHDHD